MSHFLGYFGPPPPVSHSVTPDRPDSTPYKYYVTLKPTPPLRSMQQMWQGYATFQVRVYTEQKNCIYQHMLSIDCPLCKTKYVKQQMRHSNSKSCQKLAVCQWCILQQMSQNFSAKSFQCESLAYLSWLTNVQHFNFY